MTHRFLFSAALSLMMAGTFVAGTLAAPAQAVAATPAKAKAKPKAKQSKPVPFWGAKTSSLVTTAPADLKPGEWIWGGDNKELGPIAVIVSLNEQRAYVYRNGLPIGITTVSTGKKGYTTPTGVFTILQKDKDHRSNKYNNAPMPYQQRLTWDGVALHAGGLPGYPESHGCVHLPSEFARLLFLASPMGMTVVVADAKQSPTEIANPSLLSPIDPKTGAANVLPQLSDSEGFRWQPERSPEGPVSILLSGADRRVIVLRNGVEIGRARFEIRDPQNPLNTHAYILKEGTVPGAPALLGGKPMPNWTAIAMPGGADQAGTQLQAHTMDRVIMPPVFVQAVYPLLTPGVVLVVTDAAVLPSTGNGKGRAVLDATPPEK